MSARFTSLVDTAGWCSDIFWWSSFRAHRPRTTSGTSHGQKLARDHIYDVQLYRAVVRRNCRGGDSYSWQSCFRNSTFSPEASTSRLWCVQSTTLFASSLPSFLGLSLSASNPFTSGTSVTRDVSYLSAYQWFENVDHNFRWSWTDYSIAFSLLIGKEARSWKNIRSASLPYRPKLFKREDPW